MLTASGFRNARSGRVKGRDAQLIAVDARKLTLTVEPEAHAQLVLVHTEPRQSLVEIELQNGASLSVSEVFLCESFAEVRIKQSDESRCEYVVAELSGANAMYRADLIGRNAEWKFDGVFIGCEREHCTVSLETRHEVPDCRSESLVKGVVSDNATGEFRGLVYVAPDAQHTDARQQSRNIELSDDAHIVAKPQLEIYADDVKCSHGATVGHRDDEALFYMRQRGLSERDARRLQIEGFVKDIVLRCPVAALREMLEAEVEIKLEKL